MKINDANRACVLSIQTRIWEISVFYITPMSLLPRAFAEPCTLLSVNADSPSCDMLGLCFRAYENLCFFFNICMDCEQKLGKGNVLRQREWTLQNLCRLQAALVLSIKEFSRHVFYVYGYISRYVKIHVSVFNKSIPWSKPLPDNILKILGFTFSWTGLFGETKESAWQDYGVASIRFLYSCG